MGVHEEQQSNRCSYQHWT